MKQELAGKSLSDVAKAHNADLQKVSNAIKSAREADLDSALQSGKLPAELARNIKSHLDKEIEMLMSVERPADCGLGELQHEILRIAVHRRPQNLARVHRENELVCRKPPAIAVDLSECPVRGVPSAEHDGQADQSFAADYSHLDLVLAFCNRNFHSETGLDEEHVLDKRVLRNQFLADHEHDRLQIALEHRELRRGQI